MARIKYGSGVAEMNGSIAGTTYSKNAYGVYAKTKITSHNSNTTKQQQARAAFGINAANWKLLTKVQQQAFIDAAPNYPFVDGFGDSRNYTGAALYGKLNGNLNVVGATLLTTPKVPQAFSTINLVSLAMELTAGVLTTADVTLSAAGAATESLVISVTPGQSNGINRPGASIFRQCEVVADASAGAVVDIIASYKALYGDPEVGASIFVRVAMVNRTTGQRINLGQLQTNVTTV